MRGQLGRAAFCCRELQPGEIGKGLECGGQFREEAFSKSTRCSRAQKSFDKESQEAGASHSVCL